MWNRRTVTLKGAAQSDADTAGMHEGGFGGSCSDLVIREQQQHRSSSFGSGTGIASKHERTLRDIGVKMITDIGTTLCRSDAKHSEPRGISCTVADVDLTALICYAVDVSNF